MLCPVIYIVLYDFIRLWIKHIGHINNFYDSVMVIIIIFFIFFCMEKSSMNNLLNISFGAPQGKK